MYRVLKRDGGSVEFEISKISSAMIKAFEAQGKNYHPSVINLLALQVTSDFEGKIKDGVIAVEDIQDSVERVLSDAGAALLLLESESSGERLLQEALAILEDEERRREMEERMTALGIRDANERIYDTVMAVVKRAK